MVDTMTIKAMDGNIALPGTDKDLVVMFHEGTKLNAVKSKEAGAPIYDKMDYLKIIQPGEPLNIWDQPVREQDKWRFRQHWEAYQKGTTQEVSGTPLAILFPHNPEIVKTMAAIHISTVQQLANLSDTASQNMMFGFNLRDKAKEFLEAAEKGAGYHKLQSQLEDQNAKIKDLTEKLELALAVKPPELPPQNDALAAQVAALTAMVQQMQTSQSSLPQKRGWSEESKRAHGERIRARHAAKKAQKAESGD
jgi:hypothetical protein